jgi:L-lactate dehydrogenase complex protein LldG
MVTAEETIELFLSNAAACAARTFRAGSGAELNEVLSGIIGDAESIYCPGVTEVEKAVTIPQDRRADDYMQASVCIEEVFGAVAETGSVICTSYEGKAVQASLLPSHHVALVSAANIFATLDDYFAYCGQSPPTNITLVTGPSRTADIELTLTIGVHGPERLSVVVF